MRLERGLIFWSAGGLASSVLAASVWAQAPMPPTGPPTHCASCERPGFFKRTAHHTFRVLQDNFIGYPSEFVEPPVGFYVNEYVTVQKAKADPHRFMLYRSDFLDGTNRLSPGGASRFNVMAARLRSWPGPVVVEWSPDKPGLAESRRVAVASLLQTAGVPILPERIVVGPPLYPGLMGTDAANNYNILISRDQQAPTAYSLSPTSAGSFSSAGGGAP